MEKLFIDKAIENILIDEEMKNHTSFKIGGPVDLMVLPRNEEEIIESIKIARENEIPFMIMGNGSNMLVQDGGIRGIVIKLNENFSQIKLEGSKIISQAGALLSTVSRFALKNSLKGMEFASGIPGALGGAMTMNAGAYGGEMRDIVNRVKVLDRDLNSIWLSAEEMNFRYRASRVKDEDLIVLEVEFSLEPGQQEEIEAEMLRLNEERRRKQPLEYPSGGSTFKRPSGYFAGKLIDDSGLRGLRFRDAQVSEKHCGFVVNRGQATCEDILTLIKTIQKTVRDNFGVELEREIMLIGDK